jgi:hypothetical protein
MASMVSKETAMVRNEAEGMCELTGWNDSDGRQTLARLDCSTDETVIQVCGALITAKLGTLRGRYM